MRLVSSQLHELAWGGPRLRGSKPPGQTPPPNSFKGSGSDISHVRHKPTSKMGRSFSSDISHKLPMGFSPRGNTPAFSYRTQSCRDRAASLRRSPASHRGSFLAFFTFLRPVWTTSSLLYGAISFVSHFGHISLQQQLHTSAHSSPSNGHR